MRVLALRLAALPRVRGWRGGTPNRSVMASLLRADAVLYGACMRATRLILLVCLSAPAFAGTPPEATLRRPAIAALGRDMSGADVFGVRLAMEDEEARAALRRTLPRETAWRDTRVPCADERAAPASGPRSCLAASVLAGPTAVVLRYVEDLPAHPHRSIVAEVVASQEPRDDRSKRLFHLSLLRKYGPPDLRDPTGMQWGRVLLRDGEPTLARTLPMLESSNDEIIRLSDTSLGERGGDRPGPAAQ